jgi:hypothetical protein
VEKMMREKCLLGIALALLMGVCTTVLAGDKPDPREDLATAVPEAIRLLKERKYEDFIASFVSPEELEPIRDRKKMSIKEVAAKFEKTHAALLLKILQSIEGKQPTLAEDRASATFQHDVNGAHSPVITFVKVDKLWYIKN